MKHKKYTLVMIHGSDEKVKRKVIFVGLTLL